MSSASPPRLIFFFNDPATTEIYTLSLHDALPICPCRPAQHRDRARAAGRRRRRAGVRRRRAQPYPGPAADARRRLRSEEHTSELQSQSNLVCRLLLEKKKI